jgi:serine/threonine-protein kinase
MTYAADLYALGCVIFEMLSGRPPFEGSTPDLILKHMRETAPRVSECAHGIPEALDVLVARLLEKQPQKRHRDACHLLEELKRIGDALPRVRASVAPRDIARARERRRSQLEGSRPMQAPASWERRAELFEELVRRVHGAAPPPWLTQALGDLVEGIARLRETERRTAAVAEAATKREAEIRALRLRLGRAIDELARDESRTVGVLDDLYRELAALRQAHVEAETTLTRGLAVLRDRTAGEGASRALAATLSGAGAAAARWLEADLRLESIQQEIHGREREREDLLFQIQQLKGRLASGSAEQDHELAALRESLLHLDRDRAALLDETAQRASIISEHFSKFSDIRERGTGQTPDSPNARS